MQIAGVTIPKKYTAAMAAPVALPLLEIPNVWIPWVSLIYCVGIVAVMVVDVALVMKGLKTK
jgi:hypothetical protein